MTDFKYDKEYYDKSISGFHAASFPEIIRAFDAYVSPVSSDSSILDFGCGNGFYGNFLRSRTPNLDGVDYSSVLRGNNNRQYYRNFEEADLGHSWRSPFKYDVLFSIEVIEHVEDYRQFLGNAFHALKPGGRLFLTTTTYLWCLFILLIIYRRQTSVASLMEFMRGLAGDEKARTTFLKRFWDYLGGHYHGFSKKQLRNGLEEAGFVVEYMKYLYVQDLFPVRYLDQPYNGKFRRVVNGGIPLVKALGRAINWSCQKLDLNAPNVVVVARRR